MKRLHQPHFFCWSIFNEERNIDFHSYLWVRAQGNIVIDPLPLSSHDAQHLHSLGQLSGIIITNSDHIRASQALAQETGAKLYAPWAEQNTFPIPVQHWLKGGETLIPGLEVFALAGSKTPGELALLIEGRTLITGDMVRAHEGGKLCLLPDAKLRDKKAALDSLKQLSAISTIEAVLVGDGWPIFSEGHKVLEALYLHSTS